MSDRPGSSEARAQGCKCPVEKNNHGLTPPIPPGDGWGEDGGWYFKRGCPVHCRQIANTNARGLIET